jgi:hypothetical protein
VRRRPASRVPLWALALALVVALALVALALISTPTGS